MWKTFKCPLCRKAISLVWLYRNRKKYMINCPHCGKASRFMWVSPGTGTDAGITSAQVIESIFLKRILFYCAISLPPVMIWLAYFMLVLN